MDDDQKRIFEQALEADRHSKQEIDSRTKVDLPDEYYRLFEMFQSSSGVFLESTWSTEPGISESMLRAGLKILMVEAYDIHWLASNGSYFTAFRVLRYLLEFAKRAAFLDRTMPSASLQDKLTEYDRREIEVDRSFMGKGLRQELTRVYGLNTFEDNRLDTLFGDLSAHAHGSFEEISRINRGTNPAQAYHRVLFLNVTLNAGAVSDVYLFFMTRLNFVNRDALTLRTPLREYYPLSWGALGET